MRRALLYVPCLPWNLLVCWPVVLVVWALGGTKLRWVKPPRGFGEHGLWCDMRAGWLLTMLDDCMKAVSGGQFAGWGAITLGHGGLYAPGEADDPTTPEDDWTGVETHEHVHVKQFEGVCLMFCLLAVFPLLQVWWVSIFFAWPAYVLANTLVAILRGEQAYMNSAHEEAARDRAGV